MLKKTRVIAILLVLAMCLGLSAFAADFQDVSEDDSYYLAVRWAVKEGVTNGVGHNLFAPEMTMNRAQAVTFLWRLAGEPAPEATESFSDVEAGSWYETAVQWAVEQGITNGTGGGKFSPYVNCNRAMALTLLYRMMGSPLDETAAAEPVEYSEDLSWEEFGLYFMQTMISGFRDPEHFPDLEAGSYYELPFVWGYFAGLIDVDRIDMDEEQEIVLFHLQDPCSRGEMVYFIYQAAGPDMYEYGNMTLVIPQKYTEEQTLSFYIYATDEDEVGKILTVSEMASVQAGENQGVDPDNGIGELFTISRVSEETARSIVSLDLGGEYVFAKDENGMYYVISYPTDVRFYRETNEEMNADMAQWSALVQWASTITEDILAYSPELIPVTEDEF